MSEANLEVQIQFETREYRDKAIEFLNDLGPNFEDEVENAEAAELLIDLEWREFIAQLITLYQNGSLTSIKKTLPSSFLFPDQPNRTWRPSRMSLTNGWFADCSIREQGGIY